jgi:hypothetical protein
MLGIMAARCGQCGHENNPEYRFCGICGAPLLPAITTREPGRTRPSSSVSGPSFLGLGDDRSRDLDYLLEDEPPRGHGRLYLALLLLVASAGLLAWHWQRDGFPWAGMVLKPSATSPAPSSTPDPSLAPTPVATEPTANATPPEAPSTTGTEAVPPAAAEPAAQPAPPKEAPASAVAPVQKPSASKPSPAAPSTSFEDRLVADGERYLYGRGVPEDCARAQRNLQIAARQSNAKAQTLLGAMYATGHCVNRDLPTAYRWFAKALHGDPGNSRVQRDLEVLWKQMTPEERQVAMRSQ